MTAGLALTLAYIFGGMTGWGLCRLFWLRSRQRIGRGQLVAQFERDARRASRRG